MATTTARTGTRAAAKPRTKAARAARTRADAAPRDSHGRFKADHQVRNAAFAATAVLGVAAAGIAAAFKFGLLDRFLPELDGYEDLLIDGDLRPDPYPDAVAAGLRPDPNADITVGTRDSGRPFAAAASDHERALFD